MDKQLAEMGVQTEAVCQSATAADRNAQAALSSVSAYREVERAWLSDAIGFGDHIPRRSEGESGGGGILMVGLAVKNIGRHPVFIRTIRSRFHVTEKVDGLPNVPDTEPLPLLLIASWRQTKE